MKAHKTVVLLVGALLLLIAVGLRYLPGLWPAIGPAGPLPSVPADAPDPMDATSSPAPSGPLTAPSGWTVSLLTDDVPGARDLVLVGPNSFWLSQTAEGIVTHYWYDPVTGIESDVRLTGLDRPHGLAVRYGQSPDETQVYIAEETRISRVQAPTDAESQPTLVPIADLPAGGRHFTRSLAFGPDDRLYVSIGSTCDVCEEADPEHATVISMNPDGSDRRIEATGLRNAVFLAFHPRYIRTLYVTEMGRDFLGDTLPPDEINAIDIGGEAERFGWPLCYGDRVHDTSFDDRQYVRDPCAETVPPVIALPAHVAPLGLAFLPGGDLLVSYHGSWNARRPVGYEVVRWSWNGASWTSTPFLTGFLKGSSAIGRPVDVLPMPDGSVLVSDDKAGAIWKVTPSF